jgi:hypothetical protein
MIEIMAVVEKKKPILGLCMILSAQIFLGQWPLRTPSHDLVSTDIPWPVAITYAIFLLLVASNYK